MARGQGPVRRLRHAEHTHNLGKLLFAFTCFWAYIAFSQLMLIWIANLPEEIPFYITRFKRGLGAGSASSLIVGHFFVPFALLLSRDSSATRAGSPGGGAGSC